MDKSTWPKYQHEYGAGYFDPDYYTYSDAPPSPDPHFLYEKVNGQYALVVPTTEDASFGAKFDPNLLVYQWDAFDPTSPNFGKPTPWVAAKNDPTTFLKPLIVITPVYLCKVVMINKLSNLAIPVQVIKGFSPIATSQKIW